jgi:hypothetical protein
MRKGFLLASSRRPAASAAMKVTMIASASLCGASGAERGPVDNLLAAASVKERRAAGASHVVRVECDFVTCSQWPHGYIGKTHALHAVERFHRSYPDVVLELNVTRHPYSFIGDQRGGTGSLAGHDAPLTQTWHDALLGYMGNNPMAREQAERGMAVQAASAGIQLDYGVLAQWQPVDSQRLLLWAGRFGLQEEFMSALNKRHFEKRQSASSRSTLIDAAREVGLDTAAAETFLDSGELEDVVWKSYGQTIHQKKIHSVRPPFRHPRAAAHSRTARHLASPAHSVGEKRGQLRAFGAHAHLQACRGSCPDPALRVERPVHRCRWRPVPHCRPVRSVRGTW